MYKICGNDSITSSGTGTVIKVGNFKTAVTYTPSDPIPSSFAYVYLMYVPEANTTTYGPDLPQKHPEWVMAWKAFNPGITGAQSTTMSSRLKRNLNPGDAICILTVVNNGSPVAAQLGLQCNTQYVACTQ
nr:MAG: capsid protein [Cressdnaviricota sp.]